MTAPRTIHVDFDGTLVTNFAETKNARLILDFLQQAANHGHVTQCVSSAGWACDDPLAEIFEGAANFITPTLSKFEFGPGKKKHDILIDDKPAIPSFSKQFKDLAAIWINPNSPTLERDLHRVAEHELGFSWHSPPDHDLAAA